MTGVSGQYSCSCHDWGFWRLHNTHHADLFSDHLQPTAAALRVVPQLFSKKFLVSFIVDAATVREISREESKTEADQDD